MATNHPTKTTTIEKAWRREINKRIKNLKVKIGYAFDEMVLSNRVITNSDIFNPTDEAVDRFLRNLFNFTDDYLGPGPPHGWMNRYQHQSYARGNEAALITMYPPEHRPESDLGFDMGMQPAFALDKETINALDDRAYNSTRMWARDLNDRVGIIIKMPGIPTDTIEEVQGQINHRVDVMRSRNYVIAQTETIQANQSAEINAVFRENQRLNERIAGLFTDKQQKLLSEADIDALIEDIEGIESPFERAAAVRKMKTFEVSQLIAGGFKLLWRSSQDERVRPLHRRFDGKVMSPERAQKSIQISPWNCRCAVIAVSGLESRDKAKLKALK